MMMHAAVAAAFLAAFGRGIPAGMKVGDAAKAIIVRGHAEELIKAAGRPVDKRAAAEALRLLGR